MSDGKTDLAGNAIPESDDGAEHATDISAREILKLLQLGKTVTVVLSTAVEFATLRSRLATLKGKEDEYMLGLGLIDETAMLKSEARPSVHGEFNDAGFACSFKLADKPKLRKYTLLAVDD